MKAKLVFGGLAILLTLMVGGCITPKSYVDPSFAKTTYEHFTRQAEPFKWRILVEFQRNGTHLPAADSELRGHVERVIRGSGVAVPTSDNQAPEFSVIVNNYGETGSAAAKGFGTGLTFGLVGNTVTDMYDMTVSLSEKGKPTQQTKYRHALHTAIGNESLPPGSEPMTPSAAFGNIIEQMLLKALKEIEQNTVLSFSVYSKIFGSWLGNLKNEFFG